MEIALNSCNIEVVDLPESYKGQDLSGDKYGRLEIIGPVIEGKEVKWLCGCDCGRFCVTSGNVRYTGAKSCGCYRKEVVAEVNSERSTHRMSKSPEYRVYRGMVNRCGKHPNYMEVRICSQWLGEGGFERFYADMGNRPSLQHSLDRINNEGDYSPENCRWATALQQSNNKSNNVWVTVGDKVQTVAQWAKETGLKYSTIWNRIRNGWPPEEAVSTPSTRK